MGRLARCDLDLGNIIVLPSLISSYNGIAVEQPRAEAYTTHHVAYRTLAFAYPDGQMPRRLRCARMLWQLPLRAPG